ncbi:MAG: thiamine-phosphate kinase [Phycisphaerales bacterium JB038]
MSKKLREFDLIARIRQTTGDSDDRVPIGPGDDMALVNLDRSQVLLSVDQLVAGRHYDPQTTPLAAVGRKAITRSLSDIAAMAAQPAGCVAGAVLPRDMAEAEVDSLFRAMRDAAAEFDCPLVGGDISIWEGPLVLNVTVSASPTTRGVVRRSGARPGDLVGVTGKLGGSLVSGRHLTFRPRIAEALALHGALGEHLHAMIDLSDGLGRDAGHLAAEGHVSLILDADRLPLHPGCDWCQGLGDGEDYELCFTTDAAPDLISQLEIGVAIAVVGEVRERTPSSPLVAVRHPDGRLEPAQDVGWEHGA